MSKLCVRINLKKLGERLGRGDGKSYAHADVHLWLTSQGFHHSGDSWFCDDNNTGDLQMGEIVELIKEDTVNGVTFLTRLPPQRIPPARGSA